MNYLRSLWLFAGAYFILNASILIFFPIADVSGVGGEPAPSEGLLLGYCDTSMPYTLDQRLNSLECISPDEGIEGSFSCGDPGDDDFLLSFDENSGEVRCRENPAKADQFATDIRIREMVLYSYISFCVYGFGLGFSLIFIGRKGLPKYTKWSYGAALCQCIVMIASSAIVFAVIAGVILPALAGASESIRWYASMLPAFVVQFLIQLVLGSISLVVLLRSSVAKNLVRDR